MIRSRLFAALAAVICCLGSAVSAAAAEVDCDDVYCFSAEDFGTEELSGVCITDLPEREAGTVALGNRILRPGDILTAEQLSMLTFAPAPSAGCAADGRREAHPVAAVCHRDVPSTYEWICRALW